MKRHNDNARLTRLEAGDLTNKPRPPRTFTIHDGEPIPRRWRPGDTAIVIYRGDLPPAESAPPGAGAAIFLPDNGRDATPPAPSLGGWLLGGVKPPKVRE